MVSPTMIFMVSQTMNIHGLCVRNHSWGAARRRAASIVASIGLNLLQMMVSTRLNT